MIKIPFITIAILLDKMWLFPAIDQSVTDIFQSVTDICQSVTDIFQSLTDIYRKCKLTAIQNYILFYAYICFLNVVIDLLCKSLINKNTSKNVINLFIVILYL